MRKPLELAVVTGGRPSAVVIGAGIGGIAAAARLARAGYRVRVVEKEGQPGGRCNQLRLGGHRFDTGPTLLLMPEVFSATYSALGERMEDHLDLRRIDPTYRVNFQDGQSLALTSDLNAMKAQLEAIEPGSFAGLLGYLREGHRHYRVSLERFVGRNFRHLLEYFSPSNLPLLFQVKALETHYRNVGRYFSDPRLKATFTFQNMYLGLSPYEAPATYSLLQYTELADGVWFPLGGLYRVIESLVEVAQGLGVEFRMGTSASRIEVEGRRARAVTLDTGERWEADAVVANADLPYVYRDLLPLDGQLRSLKRKRYTCSAITFYWGLDRRVDQLGTHNVFLAGDYRASFDRIFEDRTLPDEPSFYVHAPSRVDPSASPPAGDSLMVLVPVGHLDPGEPQDWDALRERARETVLQRLEEYGAGPLREHIRHEAVYTPQDWRSRYNLERGAAFGLSHNFMQVGYLRPHNRHRRYRNLYFAGASTHPGTGLPIVLLSARLAVERILEDQGRRLPIPDPGVAT